MTTLRPLDRRSVLVVMISIFGLGFQQVAVKLALPEISGLVQAALRSAGAAIVIVAILAWREPGWTRSDGTLWPGVASAVLFGCEFIALYLGLEYTSASHAAMFLYTHVFFTALGLIVVMPGERLRALQWAGLVLSFVGVALALRVSGVVSTTMLLGDCLALAGGFFWAMTTLVVKTTALRTASPLKILLYQLAGSAVILAVAAFARGETLPASVSALAIGSMLYQTLFSVVVCFSIWFWLLARYRAGEVASFTFLTPVVGVLAGWWVLGEPVAASFAIAVAMVAAGILLVNWPARA